MISLAICTFASEPWLVAPLVQQLAGRGQQKAMVNPRPIIYFWHTWRTFGSLGIFGVSKCGVLCLELCLSSFELATWKYVIGKYPCKLEPVRPSQQLQPLNHGWCLREAQKLSETFGTLWDPMTEVLLPLTWAFFLDKFQDPFNLGSIKSPDISSRFKINQGPSGHCCSATSGLEEIPQGGDRGPRCFLVALIYGSCNDIMVM